MKIRNGFVSNSSSSSFVLIVPKELHKKVLAEMDNELASAIINKFANNKFKEDKGIVVFFDSQDDYGGSWNGFMIPEGFENYKNSEYIGSPSKALYDYKKIIFQNYKDDVLYMREDF